MRLAFTALALLVTLSALAAEPMPPAVWRDLIRSYDKSVRENDNAARKAAEKALRKTEAVRRESDSAVIPVELNVPDHPATRETKLLGAQLKELAEARVKPGGTDPAKQARDIVARREFADAAQGRSQKSELERWLEDFFKKLSKLFRLSPPGGPNPNAIFGFAETMRLFLYFIVGVGILVLLYYLLRVAKDAGWFKRGPKKKKASATDDPLLDEAIEDPLSAAQLAEQSGDWRQAVRLHYIAALRMLNERGWLAMEANRTNWEYQRLLQQRNAELARMLLPATRRFDRLWYGRRIATPEDSAAARACVAAIDEATRPQQEAP